MILARAPFRISFVGGGSDLPAFFEQNYGAVVSTAIDKYVYIMIHPYFHNKIRIKYSKVEDVDHISEIKHPIVRECLKLVGVERGIEIASIADVPAGTGIGSSSTFTVCLLHALYTFKGQKVGKEKLAREACQIEIDLLKEPIGKQDQYIASYGGLNFFRFERNGQVLIEPLTLPSILQDRLFENLCMFYVGNPRQASQILKNQSANMKRKLEFNQTKKLVGLAEQLKEELKLGNSDSLGRLLDQGWQIKKRLSKDISNSVIDDYYIKAQKAGALGGKLLGAGGGGFLLFYCPKEYQSQLRQVLGLRELSFALDYNGSQIIYRDDK